MRKPKTKWVVALRALTGNERDDIRFNEALGRWEFLLTSADGVVRSQFWGAFDQPIDPFSGLHPYLELNDDGMRVALKNMESTFVGNPFDGSGTTKKEVAKRIKLNHEEGNRRYRQAGEDFADMTINVGGRGARIRGALATGWGGSPAQRSRRIAGDSLDVYALFK